MTATPPVLPSREALHHSIGRAAALGALAGAAVGLAESAKVLSSFDARYAVWACKLVAIAAGGYALAGAALSAICALVALALHGRPQHRAARASACAALGSTAALAIFAATGAFDGPMLVPAALAATVLAVTLREILGWWSFLTRPGSWAGLAGIALAVDVSTIALRWVHGPVRWVALALAVANAIGAVLALTGRRARNALGAGTIALLGLALVPEPPRALESLRGDATDVLLVTVDTLRADHLGCYGDASARTPAIDRLAAEGVLFADATSQANTTGPSHTTILTGLYPAEHGLLSNGMHVSNRARTLADALAPTHATGAFISGFTLVEESCGLAPRFDWYDDQLLAWTWMPRVAERLQLVRYAIREAEARGHDVRRSNRPAGETVDRALAWMRAHEGGPRFTWVHLFDPHAPYEPPAEFSERFDPGFAGAGEFGPQDFNWYEMPTEVRERLVADERAVQHMKALYAAEISYADSQIARILDELRASGRLERTLVVLLADHGESLGERDVWFDHGTFLYDDELHVPLIVRLPGSERSGTRVEAQVRSLDVAPTVLDVLGLSDRLETTGASFLALARGEADAVDRAAYALSDISGSVSGFDIGGRRLSLRAHGFKVIWSSPHWIDTKRVEERTEFFEVARDPNEMDDLARDGREPPAPYEHMKAQIDAWREATVRLDHGDELPADVLEHLRELGYL